MQSLIAQSKIKKIISEIRYDVTPSLNNYIWDFLEENKRSLTGFTFLPRTNGIIIFKQKQNTEIELEMDRASYLVENVLDGNNELNNISLMLSRIINKYGVKKITRFGIRYFYSVKIKGFKTIDDYAKIIFEHHGQFLKGLNFKMLNAGGFYIKFLKGNYNIRFGAFAANEETIKMYHKYHEDKEFLEPCLMTDIDISQRNLIAIGFKKINDAKKISQELSKDYLSNLNIALE